MEQNGMKKLRSMPRSARPFCKYESMGRCRNPNCLFQHKRLMHLKKSPIQVQVDPEEQQKLQEVLKQQNYFSTGAKENHPPRTRTVSKYTKINIPSDQKEKRVARLHYLNEKIAIYKARLAEKSSGVEKETQRTDQEAKRAKLYQKVENDVKRWTSIL